MNQKKLSTAFVRITSTYSEIITLRPSSFIEKFVFKRYDFLQIFDSKYFPGVIVRLIKEKESEKRIWRVTWQVYSHLY